MSWWAALPGALALVVLWLVPGWAVLRALGLRGLVGLGAAPAVTAALVGILGIAYDALGVRWSLASLLAGVAVVVALVVAAAGLAHLRTGRPGRGVARTAPPSRGRSEPLALPRPLTVGERAVLGGALAVAAVLTAGPMIAGMGAPDRPEQAWDAVFHLNALAVVRESGNASTLGALAPMYGGGSPYYPVVWHAMGAVAPWLGPVPAAANVQNLVLAAVVWPLSVAALTRTAVRPAAPALLAPVVAASFVAFPTVVLTVLAPWPFGLCLAVLPGALAVLLVALRTPWAWRPKLAAGAALALAGGGVVMAHGSGAFSVLALAGAMVLVEVVRQGLHWWRAGHPRAVVGAVAVVLVILAAVAALVVREPTLWTTLGFRRGGAATYGPALGKLLVDAPMVYDYGPQGLGNLAVTVLAAIGAAWCLICRRSRWLVVAWLGAGALVLLAAGPEDNPLRALAGFWYTQAARIAPLAVIPAAVLAALGTSTVAAGTVAGVRRLAHRTGEPRRRPVLTVAVTLLAAVTIATGGMRWDLKERITASVYTPGRIAWGTMLSEAELAMMTRLRDELPADAVVLGDPFNGSAYLPALAGVRVVFPQLGAIRGADAATLVASLNELGTDPAVCAAARRLGVTHVYTDTARAADGAKVGARTAAMRRLDTTSGLEVVDSAGTARVWRLTAC